MGGFPPPSINNTKYQFKQGAADMTNIDPRLNDIAQKIDKSNVGNKNSKILDTNEERQEFLKKAREAKIADEEIQAYFSSNGTKR